MIYIVYYYKTGNFIVCLNLKNYKYEYEFLSEEAANKAAQLMVAFTDLPLFNSLVIEVS